MRLAFCVALALMFTPAVGSAQNDVSGLAAYYSGDFATALRESRPLAEQGDAGSQSILGNMYSRGEGVPQDYTEAVVWYRKAAEQAYVFAQYRLGVVYSNGEGVPQDYVLAHMWFNLATANGHVDGAFLRDALATKMTPEDVSEAQRRARVCLESAYQDCD